MAVEIERRFLVNGDGWQQHVLWGQALRQGYLVASPAGLTLRVRIQQPIADSGGTPESRSRASGPDGSDPGQASQPPEALLTLKAPAPGATAGAALSRLEYEYAIPASDAMELFNLAEVALSKRRFGLDLPGGHWVLDVFENENAPLLIAEVELSDASQTVELPVWCGQEVSHRQDLSNAALARRPLARWSAAERRELLGEPGLGRRP